ncbi:hypothetical protein HQ35_00395 [Porphyromonas cangingivalis]|uniref:Uncharacterized protein n=2 Tax=Porphyromonas cangingivalis TaxID=36874 RepID=A0A0A2EZZ5_PORCN|nr:hypothetical protein HQ35_00395 [Porphyromonas cangingivalis]
MDITDIHSFMNAIDPKVLMAILESLKKNKTTIGFISAIFIVVPLLTIRIDGQFVDRCNREVEATVKKDSLAQYNSDQLQLMVKNLHRTLDSLSAKLDSVCRLIETRNDKINDCMIEDCQQIKATIKSLKK